jgi:phosphotransferase system  glucose/maltose/N-acetylglucosamine-specific IIC component
VPIKIFFKTYKRNILFHVSQKKYFGIIVGIIIGCLIFWLYKEVIYYHVKGFKDIAVYKNEVFIPVAGGFFAIILILLCAKIFMKL